MWEHLILSLKKCNVFIDTDSPLVINRCKKFYPWLKFYRRKKNYALDEEMMREILINSIYNLENLDDELKNFLVDKTKIKVKIIHPNQSRNYSCSGNIADFELR